MCTGTRRMALHVINNNAPPLTRNEIAQVRNEGSSQPLRVAYTPEVTSRDPSPAVFLSCHLRISSSLTSSLLATDRTYPILEKWRLVVLVATKRVSYKKVKTDYAGTLDVSLVIGAAINRAGHVDRYSPRKIRGAFFQFSFFPFWISRNLGDRISSTRIAAPSSASGRNWPRAAEL